MILFEYLFMVSLKPRKDFSHNETLEEKSRDAVFKKTIRSWSLCFLKCFQQLV
jgi:hypothetical protein